MSGAGAFESIALYGSAEQEPEALMLTTGALGAEFVAGNLRDIRFDGVEVIRAIGYIVRDKDWGTYAPVLSTQRRARLWRAVGPKPRRGKLASRRDRPEPCRANRGGRDADPSAVCDRTSR
jgi:hypothetical protein